MSYVNKYQPNFQFEHCDLSSPISIFNLVTMLGVQNALTISGLHLDTVALWREDLFMKLMKERFLVGVGCAW